MDLDALVLILGFGGGFTLLLAYAAFRTGRPRLLLVLTLAGVILCVLSAVQSVVVDRRNQNVIAKLEAWHTVEVERFTDLSSRVVVTWNACTAVYEFDADETWPLKRGTGQVVNNDPECPDTNEALDYNFFDAAQGNQG